MWVMCCELMAQSKIHVISLKLNMDHWSLNPKEKSSLAKLIAEFFLAPDSTSHARAHVPMRLASEPELCTNMWRVKVGTLLSKLCLSHFFHQITSVLGQVWLKSSGWKGRQPRRRRRWPTLIWAALKTIILLSASTQTILSKWSCSHVSAMWLEIIVRSSQPTWIQDEALTECKQSKHSFWNHGKAFSRVWWKQTKRGVFTLFGSYCYCTICLIHSALIVVLES